MAQRRAVLVTPLSGPLARFGRAGASGLRLWATRSPGLLAPWSAVDLQVIDAHPSARVAMRTATSQHPHLLFGPYGSGSAIAALESMQRVVWNHGGATSRLQRPLFAHALNIPTPAVRYFDVVLRAITASDPAIERVALLHSTTGFGQEVAGGAIVTSRELGLELAAYPLRLGAWPPRSKGSLQ